MGTTIVTTGTTDTGLTIVNGETLTVQTGGTIVSADILAGGSAYIAGLDDASTIALGGVEIVSGGSTAGDLVYGSQSVNGSTTAGNDTVFGGGTVILATNKAALSGDFSFSGTGGQLVIAGAAPTGGDAAINEGFAAGDMIVMSAFTAAATLSITTAGSIEVASVNSGSLTETFTFANTGNIELVTLTAGDELLANTAIVSSGASSSGLSVASGTGVFVYAGGAVSDVAVLGGGALTVLGTATGGSVASNGLLYLSSGGAVSGFTVQNGGVLDINGHAAASGLVVSGGSVVLESPKAEVTTNLTFAGAGTLQENAVISSGYGDLAVISGFGQGDAIGITGLSGGGFSTAFAGGNTDVTITGTVGGAAVTEYFTFASNDEYFQLGTVTGGEALTIEPIVTIASGQSFTAGSIGAGTTLDVLAGGSATGAQILSGGSAVIAGTDSGSTVFLGGTATITGTASGDIISGTETVSGADTGNTIALGGTEIVTGAASADLILGTEIVSGSGNNLTLNGGTLELSGTTATITGGLSFSGGATLEETAVIAAGDGIGALISGFGTGDAIDLSAIGTGATFSSASSGGNAVISISGGSAEGSAVESFTFAGAAGSLFSLGSISGGAALNIVNPIITVSGSSTGDVASAGYELNVLAGGTETSGVILSGATGLISGLDQNSSIALGGTETVLTGGAASGDTISGTQLLSGTATGETLAAGGSLAVAPGGTASNIVLNGGVLELTGATSNLTGGLTFAGSATLKEDGLSSPTAVISGFTTGDTIDLTAIGTGAIITSTTIGGNTVLTISGGSSEGTSAVELTMAGTGEIYALGSSGTGETLTSVPLLTSFTAGDLVVGVVGDDNDSGDYGDNQAAPIALKEYTASGQLVGEMVLSDNNTTLGGGAVEYGISGEYGSSSEGILQLAADGESLVIAGYNVNYADYNAAEAAGGLNNYGTAALAQTTSILDNSEGLTPVARVIADIGYTGTVDTSTALYDMFNENNPRSVTTVDGQVFYIAGQGDKDDTQGVFTANDGASLATAIDTSTDTRDAEIYDGQLYVSQNSSEGTANIETFGMLPVTGATTPSILSGIDLSVTLTAAQANSLNAGAVGTPVDLSPEQYFFANATTLYVADGGQPKAGKIGDGGLQKWILNPTTGQWSLAYTLSAGLNLVENGSVSSDAHGTTGLIGLTATLNADGTVTFYATNSTIGDLDQTYVYTITDVVGATTAPSNEAFTVVTTAAADTNVRGISLAPAAPTNITVSAGQTSAGLTTSTGSTLTVQAGGSITGAVILSGGTATVLGSDTGSLIVADGGETVYGSATGDNVYGTQIVSGAVSGETVYYGATMQVAAGGTATAITTQVNGVVEVSGSLSGLTMSGGTVTLDEADASVSGVTLTGSGEIAELATGTSITGVISGFGLGDAIDLTQIGTAAVLTSAVISGNTVETVTSGGISQSFTLAGEYAPGAIALASDGNGGVEIALGATSVTGTEEVTSGQFGAYITIASGATLQVDAGGTVTRNAILAGGTAVISGIASNDVIAGSETAAAGATVSGETVTTGTLAVNAGAGVSNITDESGTLLLESGAMLGGTLSLGDAATLTLDSSASLSAVISGFVYGDEIDITAMTTSATLTSGTAGGNTIETVTSGGVSESFTFAGTSYAAGYFTLASGADGATLASILPTSAVVSAGQTSAGFTVTSGFTLDVLTGGTATSLTILNGGTANVLGTDTGAVISSGGNIIISSGGIENGATILAGGTETLIGPDSATGDKIYGLQQITSANGATGTTLANETIFSGGEVDIFFKTNTLENSTILSGGLFAINGNATGTDLTLAGGTIEFESPKANLTGTLDFESGTLLVSGAVISSTFGDLATIENFGAGDVIEFTADAIGTGTSMASSTSGGNTIITLSGGSNEGKQVTAFTFAGTADNITMLQLSGGGLELLANTSVVSSGNATGGTITGGNEQLVLSGATATDTTVINGGTQVVVNGGTVTGASIEQDSTQIISSGGVAIDTTVGDPSVQIVSAGATASNTTLIAGGEQDVYGSVTSTTVDNGGTEVLYSGGTGAFNLVNSGGTLILDGGTATDTTIAAGGTLINETLSYDAGMTGTITGGELIVSDGGTSVFTLQLDDADNGAIVQVTSATDGGMELTLCFYPGTGIATPDGEVAVEALRPGDLVLTATGVKPVRWLGQSHISTRFADRQHSLPVRITQGALGDGLPVRDLLLSPDHAVFIGGILAQASALVNDVTIIRETQVPEQFTYYHVELDSHELLLAEGVQAESFVDNVDRMHFHNWDERAAPARPIAEMSYPRAKAQRQLPQAVRRMIAVAKRA